MTVSDVVEIPAGKNVWVNSYVTVHVEEKAILRVMGRFTTYNQPTGDGKIGGNLSVVNINRSLTASGRPRSSRAPSFFGTAAAECIDFSARL